MTPTRALIAALAVAGLSATSASADSYSSAGTTITAVKSDNLAFGGDNVEGELYDDSGKLDSPIKIYKPVGQRDDGQGEYIRRNGQQWRLTGEGRVSGGAYDVDTDLDSIKGYSFYFVTDYIECEMTPDP